MWNVWHFNILKRVNTLSGFSPICNKGEILADQATFEKGSILKGNIFLPFVSKFFPYS